MRTRQFIGVALASLTLFASHASAQSATTAPSEEGWQVEVMPYLWGSSVVGPVGIGNRTADVDASFSNILSHLRFAAMGFADVRRGRVLVLADTLYTDQRGQQATPGPLFSSVDPQQRMFLLTSEGGYRIVDTDDTWFDVLGGIRYWHLRSELQFQPGVLPGINLQASRGWVDGIVGVRAKRALARSWWASGYGDLGAGGSKSTYQVLGNIGVDIHDHYALLFGYRYLKVDYDKDDFLFNPAMKGPLFGFTIKF